MVFAVSVNFKVVFNCASYIFFIVAVVLRLRDCCNSAVKSNNLAVFAVYFARMRRCVLSYLKSDSYFGLGWASLVLT